MNRRDFLTRVLGVSAAALVLPHLDSLAAMFPAARADAIDGPVWRGTFAAIHEEAWKIYQDLMSRSPYPVVADHVFQEYGQLGYTLPVRVPTRRLLEPVTLAHQCGVTLNSSDAHRSIDPAMRALTQRVQYEGLDYYGMMDCALPWCVYAANRGPLRMVVQYQALDDIDLVRFDVLGGSSEWAKSLASKTRLRNYLKSRPMPRLDPARLPA